MSVYYNYFMPLIRVACSLNSRLNIWKCSCHISNHCWMRKCIYYLLVHLFINCFYPWLKNLKVAVSVSISFASSSPHNSAILIVWQNIVRCTCNKQTSTLLILWSRLCCQTLLFVTDFSIRYSVTLQDGKLELKKQKTQAFCFKAFH